MKSQGEEKEKRNLSFDTWQGELMCLKPFLFFFFNFDFAPVLAKNRNETSIPNRVSFHLSHNLLLCLMYCSQ